MKKIYLILFAMFSLFANSYAQTTLISPTGDGGFENGGTFAANGWAAVNHTLNTWQVGGVSVPFAGTNAAFISNDGGATYSYSVGTSQTSHFYRDVVIPAGETKITLSYQLKGNGESGFDRLLVYTAPTTVAPVTGTPASNSTVLTGATLVYTQTTFPIAAYITQTVSLPATLAGTTVRLIFTWQNDGSLGTPPPASVDNISLISAPPATITSTSIGGLYSSPATWVGGSVPSAVDDAIIADGAIVTIDQLVNVRDLTVGGGTSGILQWNGTANALTATRNVLVNSGANLNMFTATSAHGGVTINVGGNFTNNGTVHAAMGAGIINFNSTTSSSPSNLNGSGTFVGGIIGQLLNASTGGLTINTVQNIITRAAVVLAGPLNTNGKLSIDNTATIFGATFNRRIYNIVVTNMGTGYNTATPPTITIASPPSGGVTATATPNIDDATGTLRSITITDPGDGYSSNPTVTISGTTGSNAAAIAVNNRYSSGLTNSSIQKSGVATISGGINIRSEQVVGAIASSTALGVGYTSAPSIGFGLPFGYQNLVISGGSGYTTAPTIMVSGGTSLTGVTNPTFTVVVAQGKVVSVIAATGGTFWTSPPTLTVTGGGGSGATAAYATNCLATATATIANGAVNGYTLTNGGFGYTAAPTVSLVGGGSTAAASAFSAVALYNLTLNFFAPATVNAPQTETGLMPANRRINVLSVTNAVAGSAFTGDVEIYAAAPLTLTTSILSFGANTLFASHPAYAGTTGALTNNISGNIRLSTPGGPVTRTYPYDAPLVVVTGTGSLATGSTVTSLTASRTGAPSGTVDNGSAPTGTRAYRVVTEAGAIYGTNPTVTLNFNSNDALFSDASQLFIAQATGLTGPWTVRSIPTGTGALPATGSRTTATTTPGPIVPIGNDFYAFTTSTPPPITSVMSGDWNTGTTWNTGVVPVCANNVIINNTHTVTVTTPGNVGNNVTINSGGTLAVSAGDLTVGCTLNNKILTDNGTLTVSGGTLNVNGNMLVANGAKLNQSGGNINLDGNAAGVAASSVASGTFILGITTATSTDINLTGGVLTIVDPHVATTNTFNFSMSVIGGLNTAAAHTFRFGDGVSTDPGSANGFNAYSFAGSGIFTYGNVILEAVTAGINRFVNLNGGFYNMVANGDITINNGAELRQAGTGLTGAIVVAGNLNVNTGGILTTPGFLYFGKALSSSSTALAFSPSSLAQAINGGGTFRNLLAAPTANLTSLTIHNSSTQGVTQNLPLNMSGTLDMAAGILNTTPTNLLTVGISGASTGTITRTAGMVKGPLKKWFAAAIGATTLPLGDGTNYKPATIDFTTAPTTAGTLTGRWSATPPTAPEPNLTEGALTVNKTSTQGSWFIDAGDMLAGGTYTGTFTANGSTDVVDFAKTVLIKRPSTGGAWTLDGTHVNTTGPNSAPVLRRTGMTGFSEFGIGGQQGAVFPISIEFFRGSKLASANYLDWKVTCTTEPSVSMSLEQSSDGRNFKSIQDQTATATRCLQGFNYTDNSPLVGYNYYRLKTVTLDGKIKYSTIVVLLNKEKGFELISLAPNPVKNTAVLSLTTVKGGKIEIIVSDVAGKVILKQSTVVIAGNNPINMNFAALSAGTYIITAVNAEGELKTTRFVKY